MPPRYTGLPCFFGVPPIAAGCTSPLALPFGIPPSSFIFRKLREARFRVYRIKYSFCRIWGIYKLCTLLQRSNLRHITSLHIFPEDVLLHPPTARTRPCPDPRARPRPRPGGPVRGDRANLKVLVLGCIEAKICKKICVGKLSPRSTKCT